MVNGKYCLSKYLCGDHLDVCLPLLLMLLLLSLLPAFVKLKRVLRSGQIELCKASKCLRWERSVLGGAPQSILGPAINICRFIFTSNSIQSVSVSVFLVTFLFVLRDDERVNTCRLNPGSVSRESSSVPWQLIQLPEITEIMIFGW